jgi:hypothetical protein
VILLAAALAVAPVVVPGAQGLSVDQRIDVLAQHEARGRTRIYSAIFEDPAMRAEVRRIGFATGCSTVNGAGKEVIGRHAPALQAEIARAIRTVIPTERLAEARALSFLAMPLNIYQRRVERELERGGGAVLTLARDDMRRAFLARSKALPTSSDPADNKVLPRPDVAAALGHRGYWDLDNPAQLAFACADLLISPSVRPTITTGETPQ